MNSKFAALRWIDSVGSSLFFEETVVEIVFKFQPHKLGVICFVFWIVNNELLQRTDELHILLDACFPNNWFVFCNIPYATRGYSATVAKRFCNYQPLVYLISVEIQTCLRLSKVRLQISCSDSFLLELEIK